MAEDPVALPLPATSAVPGPPAHLRDHDTTIPPPLATSPAPLPPEPEPEPSPPTPATQTTTSNPSEVPLSSTATSTEQPNPPQESTQAPIAPQEPLPAQGPSPTPQPEPSMEPTPQPVPTQGPTEESASTPDPRPAQVSASALDSPQTPSPIQDPAAVPGPGFAPAPMPPGMSEFPPQPMESGAIAKDPRSVKGTNLPSSAPPLVVAAPLPAPTASLSEAKPAPELSPDAEPKPAINPSPKVEAKPVTENPPKVKPIPAELQSKASEVLLPSIRAHLSSSKMPAQPSNASPSEPVPARASELPNFASPPAPSDPIALKSGNAGEGQGTWVPLPNAAKRRAGNKAVTLRDAINEAPVARPESNGPVEDDQVEPVPHVVQSGENFWTISRLYYGAGRYYLALWKANRRLVPDDPKNLRVGMTIRIPPPEALDRSLIKPPASSQSPSPSPTTPMRKMSRSVPSDDPPDPPTRRTSEVELALPVADPLSESDEPPTEEPDAEHESRYKARRPVYKVRPYETLRSIARDTLGDSRRASELFELNQDVIDDPNRLTPGQLIELPEDARLGRRTR